MTSTVSKALGDLFKVIAEEAEANPAFAERIEEALAKVSEARTARRRLERQIEGFQPLAEFPKTTPEAFRKRLMGFDVAALRLLIDRNRLDPADTLKGRTTKATLADFILAAAEKRARRDAELFKY